MAKIEQIQKKEEQITHDQFIKMQVGEITSPSNKREAAKDIGVDIASDEQAADYYVKSGKAREFREKYGHLIVN